MEIYYVSGTGNSLHLARELGRRIPGTSLVPIIGVLKNEKTASTSDVVGIIFPIHCLGLPQAVIEFLRKADLRSASHIFAIATRECSSTVFAGIDKLLARHGRSLAASYSVTMPQTYLPMFEMSSEEENAAMESAMQSKLELISADITSRRPSRERDKITAGLLIYYALSPVVRFAITKTRYFGLGNAFYADQGCTGCGRCAKVCLRDRISIAEGRPIWDRRTPCLFCFACIHYCPAQAIQIKHRKTTTKGRYHHPQVTAEEIAAQKRRS